MKKFVRAHWLTLLVAAIGFWSSYYFYEKSLRERDPVFFVDPVRPLLVEADSIRDAPLRLVTSEGNSIEKNVSVVLAYFWNSGRLSIRNENILRRLQIVVDSSDVDIIDYRIVSETRPDIVGASLKLQDDASNTITLGFDILEKNDGIAVQVIYAGDENAPVLLVGAIEGVVGIGTIESLTRIHLIKSIAIEVFRNLAILSIGAAVVLVGAAMYVLFRKTKWYKSRYPEDESQPETPDPDDDIAYVRDLLIFGLIVLLGVLYVAYDAVMDDNKSLQSMLSSIPTELRSTKAIP